jgi:RNA polymerase sigma factor (sigma-70 family)
MDDESLRISIRHRAHGLFFFVSMGPEELFHDNLPLIDRVSARVCRNARLIGADAEDFASAARLQLMENGYAALRKFEGRCSLGTYLTIVIQRMLMLDRMRAWGRWNASTAAQKLGDAGLRAEQLIRRDGRTIDEALPILRDLDPALTRARLEEIVAQLPERKPRLRVVDAEEVEEELLARESSETRVVEREVQTQSERATVTIRGVMAAMTLEDRTIVRLHFHAGMTLAEIARALAIPQRPLYRRLERILATLRDALGRAGLDRGSVADLIGSKLVDLDFGLRPVENVRDSSSFKTEERA